MAAQNICNNGSTVALFDSIRRGEDAVTIQALLQEGADINAGDSIGFTPLLLACLQRREELVALLIKSGANVDAKFLRNWTALHIASESNWIEIVRTLVKKVSDLDARDHEGETSMHYAARSGCVEVVKCLIEEGADINMKNIEDFTPLLIAAKYSKIEVVDLLLGSKANVDEGKLLYYASNNGWTSLVHSLVKRVPDLNKWHGFGETALHAATMDGCLEIVKCLVKEGTDINIKNCVGQAALHLAHERSPEMVNWLLENGSDIELRDDFGDTVLHVASGNGCLEIVKCLVKRNCDLDARNFDGATALTEACISRRLNIVQYLLQAGARWDIEDENGDSPLNYLAFDFPHLHVGLEPEFKFIKLFIENGAYLKHVDYEAIVKSSSLKVLQDEELCFQAIVNKFNNKDLPELYKLPVSGSLPRIEEMKIVSGTEVAQAIRRTVGLEIQRKGHCNVLKVRPMTLSAFTVRSVLEYCEKKKLELRNSLKRPAALDPSNKCQPSSKVARLS